MLTIFLPSVKCYSRSDCHGLHVDAGRCVYNGHKKDRLCLVCKSSQHNEDEHHFVFDCNVYRYITARHASPFQQTSFMSDFLARYKPNACGDLLGAVFLMGAAF